MQPGATPVWILGVIPPGVTHSHNQDLPEEPRMLLGRASPTCVVARTGLPGGAVVVVRPAQTAQVLGSVVVAVADVVHVGRVHCAAARSVELGNGQW